MAKLSDLIQQRLEKEPDKTPEQIGNDLYDGLQAQLRKEREKSGRGDKAHITAVECTVSGELQYTKSIKDGADTLQANKAVASSEVLGDLSILLRPLLQVAKSLYTSGPMQSQELKKKDVSGRTLKESERDVDGEILLQPNAAIKLRMLLYVLENNEEARSAIKTINSVLSEYTSDRLRDAEVNKKTAKGTKSIRPRFRSDHSDDFGDR
jgi:hypothetical protein